MPQQTIDIAKARGSKRQGGQIFILDIQKISDYNIRMTRPLRIQFPGAIYHVMNRGNEKRAIFNDDKDRERFLTILSQSIKTYNIDLYCFVLMKNHFHLLLETPLGNLGEFMRQFNISYTFYFNQQHDRVGHLFQGRYKSILVEKDYYLTTVSRYIHLNPSKTTTENKLEHKQQLQHLLSYKWSSLPGYLNFSRQVDFVEYETVLAEYGGKHQTGMDCYAQHIAEDLTSDIDVQKDIVGQSILGRKKFIAKIKATYLKNQNEREKPAVGKIQTYLSRDIVISLLADEFGIDQNDIFTTAGEIKQMTMTVMYNYAGLNNREIGELFGVDYSTVSQNRKRLREKVETDKETEKLLQKIELRLSRIKI